MAPDVLQQLRDIHLPVEPGWWPPAPGWWLLAAAALAGLAWVGRYLYRFYRRALPVRRAQRLHETLRARLAAGDITPLDYLNGSNELLKRLLIHGLGMQEARPVSGRAWLELLDRCYGAPAFTSGPGAVLGDERFRPGAEADVGALQGLLGRLFRRLGARGAGS